MAAAGYDLVTVVDQDAFDTGGTEFNPKDCSTVLDLINTHVTVPLLIVSYYIKNPITTAFFCKGEDYL